MTTTTPPTEQPPRSDLDGAPPAYPVRPWGDIRQDVDTRGLVTKEVPSPEFGAMFKVRGLSRAEKHYLNGPTFRDQTGRLDASRVEEEMLCIAVVEPPLKHEEYKALRHNATINPVFDRLLAGINELTNGTTLEDAVAAAEARFRPGQ